METERGHYACLSHCWGTPSLKILKTTADTFASHVQGIEMQSLPQTFRDAIHITAKLGLRYIWIDSLCIIQHDKRDWAIQSAKMKEIYQRAFITIAASASSGPSQGLFRQAQMGHIDHPLPEYDSPGSPGTVHARNPLSHEIARLPLLQRAWVFQERLLSPRFLHFGDNELVLECMERVACECGGFGESSQIQQLIPKNRFHPQVLRYLKDDVQAIRDMWQATICDYARMQLTKPEDLFPAMSGVSQSVRDATGWRYVAGLWEEDLVLGLLWSTNEARFVQRCRPPLFKWRAPSFSWASVIMKKTATEDLHRKLGKSHISYSIVSNVDARNISPLWRLDQYIFVEEVSSVPASEDQTGILTAAYIILRGTLIHARLMRNTENNRWHIATLYHKPLFRSILLEDFDYEEHDGIKHGAEVFCLKMVGRWKARRESRDGYFVYLVLKTTESKSDGQEEQGEVKDYERIGIMRDSRVSDEVRLEEVSEPRGVQHDALVKIR